MEGIIIPTWIIYAISVAANVGIFLRIILAFLMIGAIVFVIAHILELDEYRENVRNEYINIVKKVLISIGIITALVVIIPSEKTLYAMLVNQFITYENLDAFKGGAIDFVDYVFEKIVEVKGK